MKLVVSETLDGDGQALIDETERMRQKLLVDMQHLHHLLTVGGDSHPHGSGEAPPLAGKAARDLQFYINCVQDDLLWVVHILDIQGAFYVNFAHQNAQIDTQLTHALNTEY